MDFYKIGCLNVFLELGKLIEEDEKQKIKFTDLPNDILNIIKGHVTTFSNDKEQFRFLSKFEKEKNKDIYKFFFNKEPNYFITDYSKFEFFTDVGTETSEKYKYKFYFKLKDSDDFLKYINEKYKRNEKNCFLIVKYDNGIKANKCKKYIEVGDIAIGYNNYKENKLQFYYGIKGYSKEYNIPHKFEKYLNDNVWNINLFL